MAIDKADAFISINANGPERPVQKQIERHHEWAILWWLHFTRELEQSTIYAYTILPHTRCNLQCNTENGFGVDI